MRTLGILVTTVLLAAPVQAKPLYVNNSGSPACSDATTHADNDADHPWCTLLRAVRGNADGDRNTPAVPGEAAQAGDTVHIAAGTYDYSGTWVAGGWLEPLYESVNSGTSWDAPIVYQADGTVHLTVSSDVDASTLGGHVEYVKWIGFTIHQETATFRNGLTTITADHVHFENLTLIGTYTYLGGDNHAGIFLAGPRDGDCTDAIGDIVIRNCTIQGFTGDSGRNDAGITTYCAAGGSSGTILIENNEISGSGNGVHAKSSYTPASNDPAMIVRKNRFHGNGGSGIMTQAWSNWHVYQNLFTDNGTGIAVMAFQYYVGEAQPTGYVVANNTLVGNQVGFRLEGFCDDASDMLYRNNIVVNSTQHAIWGESPDCSTGMTKSNYDFDYNLYGQGGSFGDLHYIGFDLATWQSATYDHQDTHSADGVDPLFTDPDGDDYTLQAGSPCREGGTNDGVDVLDLDGDGSTDDAITLGAYITGDEVIGPTDEPATDTCAELGGLDCCVGDETCPGTALGPASDCPGVCCAVECTPGTSCTDADGDGYGDPASADCAHPEADCDDGDDTVHPGAAEACNAVDDDCDAQTDEDWPDLGTACTAGVGACEAGGQVACLADGTGAACDAVPGEPTDEVCGNDIDEDCDGVLDNGDCPCTAGDERPCYTGPASTEGVGTCQAGVQTCEQGIWSSTCDGEVVPVAEDCTDSLDNDCDGDTDGADSDCEEPCADADGDGHANAVCGGDDCNDSDAAVHPGADEICDNGRDDDCDGDVDEDCADEVNGGCGCGATGPASGLPVAAGLWVLLGVTRRCSRVL